MSYRGKTIVLFYFLLFFKSIFLAYFRLFFDLLNSCAKMSIYDTVLVRMKRETSVFQAH